MGTYYEIRCMDCDEDGGIYADRARYLAEAALSIAAELGAIAAAFNKVTHLVPSTGISIGGCELDLAFFAKHAGHRMTVADGYGCDLDQCRAWLGGVCTGEPCALAHGHPGEHAADGPHRRKRLRG